LAHPPGLPLASMKRPAAAAAPDAGKQRRREDARLPVSTICGFLGAGKTTLLKHVLEARRADGGEFRCAVIVNDMAELNIDESLVRHSDLVQSDDVIAMDNGCVCCTLRSDLVEQIIGLAKQKKFDYMIVEASGVSEPAQMARVFAPCDKDHEHDEAHGERESLSDLARLDTCVTVVDAADFFNNLEAVARGPEKQSLPHLLVEQIEYANVVVLNKADLVSQLQLARVEDMVSGLNPRGKILTSRQSRIDALEVVNTGLYRTDDFASLHAQLKREEEQEEEETFELACCSANVAKGLAACCAVGSAPRVRDSGKSRVVLASSHASGFQRVRRKGQAARHASRFGIASFLYKARRPFHPERFDADLVRKFFLFHDDEDGEEEGDGDGAKPRGGRKTKREQERREKDREEKLRKRQEEASEKEPLRTERMGSLLRSKGFIWLANRHDFMGVYSSVGSVLTLSFPTRWNALEEKAYTGTPEEQAELRKHFVEVWGDRRQELVFIGKNLKHEAIQEVLDGCLLTDKEMSLGIDGWKATLGDIMLDAADEEDSGGEGE